MCLDIGGKKWGFGNGRYNDSFIFIFIQGIFQKRYQEQKQQLSFVAKDREEAEHPEDLQLRNIDDKYFFGKDMVVCPVTMAQKGVRQVYLPEGKWYDLFSGEETEGGRSFSVKVDVEKIPVYVRDGAVVPFAEPVQCVQDDTVFRISVRHYRKKMGCFVLYEDDFVSYDYEKRGFHEVRISVDGTGQVKVLGISECLRYSMAK